MKFKKKNLKKQPLVQQTNHGDSDSNQEDTQDIFTDEINEFTEARNKVDLNNRDNDSEEEEELFALDNDDEESDEEINEWNKRLKQVKFQAKLDKKKVLKDAPEKSWGSKRTDFYGSDVRRKPKTAVSDEEDEWIMEAKELEKLQKKMDEDMDEDDFMVPNLIQKTTKSDSNNLKLKRDLSETAKKELQQQHHPEIEPLRDEMSKCIEQVELLKDVKGWRAESMDTVFRMYGAHIAFYLHLLECGEDTRGHPVLDRLVQWKKLAKVYEGFPLESMEASDDEEKQNTEIDMAQVPSASKMRMNFGDSDEESKEENESDEEQLTNRPINYLIEKNKPKKKSAPNNPRVKHREKFRKAKIRRRGKIRDFKPEVQKYRGEASGIRSGIVRSMRLK